MLTTLVGYSSTPGHNHDDNCISRSFVCEQCGNIIVLSKRRKCNVPGCDWIGKKNCFCHEGEKIDFWPDEVLGDENAF